MRDPHLPAGVQNKEACPPLGPDLPPSSLFIPPPVLSAGPPGLPAVAAAPWMGRSAPRAPPHAVPGAGGQRRTPTQAPGASNQLGAATSSFPLHSCSCCAGQGVMRGETGRQYCAPLPGPRRSSSAGFPPADRPARLHMAGTARKSLAFSRASLAAKSAFVGVAAVARSLPLHASAPPGACHCLTTLGWGRSPEAEASCGTPGTARLPLWRPPLCWRPRGFWGRPPGGAGLRCRV